MSWHMEVGHVHSGESFRWVGLTGDAGALERPGGGLWLWGGWASPSTALTTLV